MWILIFKGLTVQRLYKSYGVRGLKWELKPFSGILRLQMPQKVKNIPTLNINI
jgi:hypothetical protein